MTEPLGIDDFQQAVERHWRHHAPSHRLSWDVEEDSDGWRCGVAPARQEVVGGDQDGAAVWAGFEFDLGGFSDEYGVNVGTVLASSRCVECSETPHITVQGAYFGRPFSLKVHLEPVPGSPPTEFVEANTRRVRGDRKKRL